MNSPSWLKSYLVVFISSVYFYVGAADDRAAFDLLIKKTEGYTKSLKWDSVGVYVANLRKIEGSAALKEEALAYADMFESHVFKRSDIEKALGLARSAKSYFEDQGDIYRVMTCEMAIGNSISNSGKQQASVKIYLDAIAYAEAHPPVSAKVKSMCLRMAYNSGFSMIKFGDLDNAAKILSEARELATELKDTLVLAHVFNQFGNIELRRSHYRACIDYNLKGLALTKLINSPSGIYMEGAIGSAYSGLGIIDSAKLYLERVVDVRRQGTNKYSLAVALLNLSEAYRMEERCDVSNDMNSEVAEIARDNGQMHLLLDAEINLCICAITNRDFYKAYQYYKKGVDNLNDAFQFTLAADLYLCGARALEGTGNYKNALALYKLHKTYSDSLINEESEAAITELEKKYDFSKQEAEILVLESNSLKNQWEYRKKLSYLGSGLLVLSIAAGWIYFVYRRKVLAEEQKRINIERKLLRFQMNPHFIFNAISSIQNFLFDKSDLKIALTYLSRFAELMRQTLENSREVQIPLSREIDSLENYLQLQQLRYQNKFEYEVRVAESLNQDMVMVPPLIAQPFVENAIEHGQIYQVQDGKVIISFDSVDNELQLTVADNGVGIRYQEAEKSKSVDTKKSLATIITRERLGALSRQGKKKFDLVIEQLQNGGTLVTIGLPKMI